MFRRKKEIVCSLCILFFFAHGGLFLFSRFNANWAYIFDQLGLSAIAVILLFKWLRKKKVFSLGLGLVVLISVSVILVHFNSFYRAIFDEWVNIIAPLNIVHDKIAPPELTGFYVTRDRYGWAPFAAFYETVGLFGRHSNFLLSAYGILMIVGAAITGAWVTGVISGKKSAALIAGLLIGISPNTFASLPWPSSLEGESFGIILVLLGVGTWIISRRTKNRNGILLAILFLAASLKGGGSVRTITTGLVFILTDLLLFAKSFKKLWVKDWFGIVTVEISYYIFTAAVHMTARNEAVPLVVRFGQIMELTTKTFVPPTILSGILEILISKNSNITWVIVIGIAIFAIGSIAAFFAILKRGRNIIFAWGWLWFYFTVFYAPWFAEGYGSTLASISDRASFNLLDMAGYKYAYLPLLGIHIFLGVWLAAVIAVRKRRKVFVILSLALVLFRSWEFLNLDYQWRIRVGEINREWQNTIFTLIPRKSADARQPSVLVLVDGIHNPIANPLYSVQNGVFSDGSVIFYADIKEFYRIEVLKNNITLEKVFALAWDSGKQKMINLTEVFRNWLRNRESASWETNDFTGWISESGTKNGFFIPGVVDFGDFLGETESRVKSPELALRLPNPNKINLSLRIYLEDFLVSSRSLGKDVYLTVGVVCNSDHGKKVRSQLVGNQETLEDQISNFKRKISFPRNKGEVWLSTQMSCDGGVLKQIVLVGSSDIQYKLINLKIEFPLPSKDEIR